MKEVQDKEVRQHSLHLYAINKLRSLIHSNRFTSSVKVNSLLHKINANSQQQIETSMLISFFKITDDAIQAGVWVLVILK